MTTHLLSPIEKMTPFEFVRELFVCQMLSMYKQLDKSINASAGERYAKTLYVLELMAYENKCRNEAPCNAVSECCDIVNRHDFMQRFAPAFIRLVDRVCPDSAHISDEAFKVIYKRVKSDLESIPVYSI